jgi:hypothetical protein
LFGWFLKIVSLSEVIFNTVLGVTALACDFVICCFQCRPFYAVDFLRLFYVQVIAAELTMMLECVLCVTAIKMVDSHWLVKVVSELMVLWKMTWELTLAVLRIWRTQLTRTRRLKCWVN